MGLDWLMEYDWFSYSVVFIDRILFGFYFLAVIYLLIFSLGALRRKNKGMQSAKKFYRYMVIFHMDGRDKAIIESVSSLLKQDFPRDNYDICVATRHQYETANRELELLGVKLLYVNDDATKVASEIKTVLDSVDSKLYDVIVLMDTDSVVEKDFLAAINNAYYSGGAAIQAHRVVRETKSDIELFRALSAEINNSIFRKGHVNLGLSSALMGSGMAFKAVWLKDNIKNVVDGNLEKQLEIMLLKQFMFISYLSEVRVYGDNVHSVEQFHRQRRRWAKSRVRSVKVLLKMLPSALLNGNYDYADKLFQWLLPSRVLLIGTLPMIIVILFILSWGMAIKWIILFLLLIFAFSIAVPDQFIDARFIKALRSAPLLFALTAFNTIKGRLMKSHK